MYVSEPDEVKRFNRVHQILDRYVEAKLKKGWKRLRSTFHEKVAEAAKNSLMSDIDTPVVDRYVEARVAAIKEKMTSELDAILEEGVQARVAALKGKLSALMREFIDNANGHLDELHRVLDDIMETLPNIHN